MPDRVERKKRKAVPGVDPFAATAPIDAAFGRKVTKTEALPPIVKTQQMSEGELIDVLAEVSADAEGAKAATRVPGSRPLWPAVLVVAFGVLIGGGLVFAAFVVFQSSLRDESTSISPESTSDPNDDAVAPRDGGPPRDRTPLSATELAMVRVAVRTRPSGARVFVEDRGEVCGPTPCSFQARTGQPIILRVRGGRAGAEAELTPSENTTIQLEMRPDSSTPAEAPPRRRSAGLAGLAGTETERAVAEAREAEQAPRESATAWAVTVRSVQFPQHNTSRGLDWDALGDPPEVAVVISQAGQVLQRLSGPRNSTLATFNASLGRLEVSAERPLVFRFSDLDVSEHDDAGTLILSRLHAGESRHETNTGVVVRVAASE